MNEILCPECGESINKHHSPVQHKGGTCPRTPQDIAAHHIDAARKDAFFLADVWTTIRVMGLDHVLENGDPDGIDYVAAKVINEQVLKREPHP